MSPTRHAERAVEKKTMERNTITSLTSELFTNLVVFRHKVRNGVPMRAEAVAQDFEMIFARMDKAVEDDVELSEAYHSVRKNLAILVDGIVTGSDWDQALDYRSGHLLENKFYQSNRGGDSFYEDLKNLAPDDAAAREICFLGLALGFQGRHAHRPELRMDAKKRLYLGLPERILSSDEKLSPQAYKHTDERNCPVPPVARFGRYAIVLCGLLLFLLLLGRSVYDRQASEISAIVQEHVPAAAVDTVNGKR